MLIELEKSFNDNGIFIPKDLRNQDYKDVLERIKNGENYQVYDQLEDSKETKRITLKTNRQAFQYSNIIFGENVFKATESAQNKLANKIYGAQDDLFIWNDAFNNPIALTLDEARSLLRTIIDREDSAYSQYAQKLKEINDESCTTIKKLETININFE